MELCTMVLVVYWGNEGTVTTLVPISLRRVRFIETAGICDCPVNIRDGQTCLPSNLIPGHLNCANGNDPIYKCPTSVQTGCN